MTRRFSRTSSNRSDGSSNYSAPSSSSGSDSEQWQWQWQWQPQQHDQYNQSPSGYGYESYESEQQCWDPLVTWQQQQQLGGHAPAGIAAKKYKPYRPPPDQYPLHIAPIEQEVQMPAEDEWEEEGWPVWPVEVLGLRVTELAESDAGYSPPLPPHRIAPTPPRLATPAPGPGTGRRRSSVARIAAAAPAQQPPPPEEHHYHNYEEVEAPLVGGASRRRQPQQQQQPRSSMAGPGAADRPIRFGEVKWGEAPAQEKREECGGGGPGEKTTTHRCRFQALSMARTVLARGG